MDNKQDEWIALQCRIYAGASFGETELVVNWNIEAYKVLLKYAKKGLSFLDVGCNNGRISHEMQKLELNVLGIDLPEIINKITYPINKLALNLEKDFPVGRWDIIFCRETIEHLRNYEEVLQKMLVALNPDGFLIITAPFSKQDFGKNCPQHIRIFEGDELKKLIEKHHGVIIESFMERKCRSLGFVVKYPK